MKELSVDIIFIAIFSCLVVFMRSIKKEIKMNFDIKDVKSWASRHDVETKSVGFFGNSLLEIDNEIRRYNKGEKDRLHMLYQISDNGCYCFGFATYFADTGAFSGTNNFAFFLPLDALKKDKPKEKKYRSFEDTYELYKFLLPNTSLARKDFSNKLLLNLPITYREIKSPQYTIIELITRVVFSETDKACKIFINKRDFEDWFANYEIMNAKGEWQPFGVEV